jgi:hypothetical protein
MTPGRFHDPNKSDLLVVTLRVDDGDVPFVLDRRIAEHLIRGLTESAKKLTAPRPEN